MGTENWNQKFTFLAGEDLHTAGHVGVAIALDDGKVANNGLEAAGILATKPKSGEYGAIVMIGIGKGRAGGALVAGGNVTVATSGYFNAAGSGDNIVGIAMEAVTSGSLGPIGMRMSNHYASNSLM
jgi:hypothetical protein